MILGKIRIQEEKEGEISEKAREENRENNKKEKDKTRQKNKNSRVKPSRELRA